MGNSKNLAMSAAIRSVHPRTHGELFYSPPTGMSKNGSSPYTRGTLLTPHQDLFSLRFIPVHTGNSFRYRGMRSRATVHPRTHGELQCSHRAPSFADGSSPYTRGTHQHETGKCYRIRFIPVHTGNSCVSSSSLIISTVHPRTHGELGVQVFPV